MPSKKKIVYWTGLITGLVFFGALGLTQGLKTGQAQSCRQFQFRSCQQAGGDCCGGGYPNAADTITSGTAASGNWRLSICYQN